MGESFLARRGGGTDTSDATATANDILASKTFYGADGEKSIGTMSNKINSTQPCGESVAWDGKNHHFSPGWNIESHPWDPDTRLLVTIPVLQPGYYDTTSRLQGDLWGVSPYHIRAGARIGHPASPLIGTFTADATAVSGDVLAGKTAYVNGAKVTGTISDYRGTVGYNDRMGVCDVEIGRYSSWVSLCYSSETACINSSSRLWLEHLVPSNVKKGVTLCAGDGEMDLFTGTYEALAPKLSVVNFSDYFNPNSGYEYVINTFLSDLTYADKVNTVIIFDGAFMDSNVKFFVKHTNCTADTSVLTNLGYTYNFAQGYWQGGEALINFSMYDDGSHIYANFENETAYSGPFNLNGTFKLVQLPLIIGNMEKL